MDKTKAFEQYALLQKAEQDREMLNPVYKEISEKLGIDTAVELYQMFRGQQISFPVRLKDPQKLRQVIVREYNGTNARELARQYGYSEKSIRRIVKTG